jgi:hypothetical protein
MCTIEQWRSEYSVYVIGVVESNLQKVPYPDFYNFMGGEGLEGGGWRANIT